jgi:hypothetical protein
MRTPTLRIVAYSTVAVVILAALTYFNHRIATAAPGGVDFLTHWVGTRALFHGESPYSDAVARQVQSLYYGRLALPGENEFLDPYMLYLEALFAPFALLPDFSWARAVWMTVLEAASLAIYLISMAVVEWKPKPLAFAFFALYAFFGYHTVRPIINGNVTTVMVLMLVAAVWAIKNGREGLGGFLLAVFVAKPNLAIVPILLLVLWMGSRQRWQFIGWFAGTFAVLVVAGMLVIPDWPLQNLSTIMRYTSYNPPTTIGMALESFLPGVGTWIGIGIYVLLTIVLLAQWRISWRKEFADLLPVLCFTLVASQWLWISTDPGNFILLALPLAYMLMLIDKRPMGQAWVMVLLSVLLVGLWLLFLITVDRERGNLQSPVMFFPLPGLLILGLALLRQHGGLRDAPPHAEGLVQ